MTSGTAERRLLGASLRFSGELDARTREPVISAVAARWSSAYEWYAHSRMGRSDGGSGMLAAADIPAQAGDDEAEAL